MRWQVTGANSQTGQDETMLVNADSQAQAELEARGRGLLVEDVRPAVPPPVLSYSTPGEIVNGGPQPPPTFYVPPAPVETVFLTSRGVTVTNARVIILGKTYAVANVTSVNAHKVPPNRSVSIWLLIIGAVITTCAMAGAPNGEPASVVLAFLLGFGLLALGVLAWTMMKPSYAVRMASSSGEVDVLMHKDWRWIARIVESINQAIISRGLGQR